MAQKTNPFYDFLASSFGQVVVTLVLMLFLFGTSAFIAYQANKVKILTQLVSKSV